MNKHHLEILEEIRKISRTNPKQSRHFDLARYMGTKHFMYQLTSSEVRDIAKNWVKKNKDISLADFEVFLNSLYQGESHEERTIGGKILEYLPSLRKQMHPSRIERWLTGSQGWGEVDSLCQNPFGGEEILSRWDDWEMLLKNLVIDQDVHKRRASLVLLTRPVRDVDDKKMSDLAFENIDKLKHEKDILITKAISWLLRSLIKFHKEEVEEYLSLNENSLPKIAIRETRKKLLTGKK